MYVDVGSQQPDGFPHNRWRGQGDDIMGVEVERMLQSIHTNFVPLTHRVPMVQVKDSPKAIQHQVVDVPRAWVRLFRRLARAVVCYHDQNPPPPPQA